MIWWYGLSPEVAPEADPAPAHAGVPALVGVGVDVVDVEGGGLPSSGGRVPATKAEAMAAGSETVRGPSHRNVQQICMCCCRVKHQSQGSIHCSVRGLCQSAVMGQVAQYWSTLLHNTSEGFLPYDDLE